MWKEFLAFFNKNNLNISEGIIDPYKYHLTCYYILKCFQVIDNEPKPKWRYLVVVFLFISTFLALYLLVLSAYHGFMINDLTIVTESVCYFIVLFYQVLMLLCTIINVPQYRVFLSTLRSDFLYMCTDGEKYRKRYFENQLTIWKMCLLSVIFTSFIGIAIVVVTLLWLLWYAVTHEPGDGTKRPMLFPIWLYDIDVSATPYYEIIFIFTDFCCLSCCFSYIFMIQTQIFWVGEICAKADLIIWYIEDLLDDIEIPTGEKQSVHFKNVIQLRMSQIIREHNVTYRLLENFTKVYKKMLMFEQKAAAPVVCLTVYSSAEKLSVGEINGISMLLCCGTVVEVFIPSYLSTVLSIKLRSIGEACWNIPFWNIGIFIRPYIILIIQRSFRELRLKAPGFEEVSVQTFSNKMASAYSFFNMLRQANL